MERITVDGITFRPAENVGAWLEVDDPDPKGSVGRMHMPMLADGSPEIDQMGEIEVHYDEA